MENIWLHRAEQVEEDEVVLVRKAEHTKAWYDRMPSEIAAIFPENMPLEQPEDFAPKVGFAHHLRLTRFGIEGVLRMPHKYFRMSRQVLYNRSLQPQEPFWVVLRAVSVKKSKL